MVTKMPIDSTPKSSILIVGGTGHVGASLTLHLADQGHQVTASAREPSPGLGNPKISEIPLDLRRPSEGLPAVPFETAVICPWVLDDQASSNWLDLLIADLVTRGLRSVLYFSSIWVYGEPLVGKIDEQTTPTPTNAYGKKHLDNEVLLAQAAVEHELDVKVLRMSNLIGANPLHGHREKVSFSHEMATMALHDRRIVLRSPATTRRDLVARARLHHQIDALLKQTYKPGNVETFNLGGGQTTTVGDFARSIAAAATRYHGDAVDIEHPDSPEDPLNFHLDSSKIEAIAGLWHNDLNHEVSQIIEDVLARGERQR